MIHRGWTVAIALIGLLLCLAGGAAAQNIVAGGGDNPRVPNVLAQFNALPSMGEPLGYRIGVGDTHWAPRSAIGLPERTCKHYQGIARGKAPDGTPYMFITHSENITQSCEDWTPYDERWMPGELLIVRMGSRAKDGERLRSNRLKRDKYFSEAAPPDTDLGVLSIRFNGQNQFANGDGTQPLGYFPKAWHPGAPAIIDDVLIVPIGTTCAGLSVATWNTCEDTRKDQNMDEDGLVLIDVRNPERPTVLLYKKLGTRNPGTVGVTKDPVTGRYWFDTDHAGRFWSDTDDLRTTSDLVEDHTAALPVGLDAPCWEPQSWHMIREDKTGDLYRIETCNTSGMLNEGDDMISLVKVSLGDLSPYPEYYHLYYWFYDRIAIKHIEVQDADEHGYAFPGDPEMADLGNLNAVGGTYVTPSGQLILYTGDHRAWDVEGVKVIEGGEFSALGWPTTDGTSSGPRACGSKFSSEWGQTFTLTVGQTMRLRGASYVEPWLRLYEDAARNTSNPEKSVLTVDSADQFDDDFDDLGHMKFFNDWTNSFEWCGPEGASLSLYDDSHYSTSSHAYLECSGSGRVETIDNVATLAGTPGGSCVQKGGTYSLNDRLSSVTFGWTPSTDPMTNSWQCVACPGGSLTPALDGMSAIFTATSPETNRVQLTHGGASRMVTINVVNAPPGGARRAELYTAKAGAAYSHKFVVTGDQGPTLFAEGYPASQPVDCATLQPTASLVPTAQAGARGLAYANAEGGGWYTYVWKTDKAWAGTCRAVVIQFTDGTEQRAYFRFN